MAPQVETLYESESGLCVQYDNVERMYSITTGDEQERLVISGEMLDELQDARIPIWKPEK